MDIESAYAEIVAFFDNGYADASPVSYPDIEFTPPNNETYAVFNCQEVGGTQASTGAPSNNRFRHFGIVTVQIFQPSGSGSKDAREKAKAALAVFMGKKTTNGIIFSDVAANTIGNDGNGFYQINVTTAFRYDQIT